jgi:hypothetical protein
VSTGSSATTSGTPSGSPYVDEEGNEVTIKAFPGGLSGVGRCIGYELTDTTITPVLADAEIYQESS